MQFVVLCHGSPRKLVHPEYLLSSKIKMVKPQARRHMTRNMPEAQASEHKRTKAFIGWTVRGQRLSAVFPSHVPQLVTM